MYHKYPHFKRKGVSGVLGHGWRQVWVWTALAYWRNRNSGLLGRYQGKITLEHPSRIYTHISVATLTTLLCTYITTHIQTNTYTHSRTCHSAVWINSYESPYSKVSDTKTSFFVFLKIQICIHSHTHAHTGWMEWGSLISQGDHQGKLS